MFTRKPRLRPAEFLITSAKRLLQHNRHIASFRCAAKFGRFRSEADIGQPLLELFSRPHNFAVDDYTRFLKGLGWRWARHRCGQPQSFFIVYRHDEAGLPSEVKTVEIISLGLEDHLVKTVLLIVAFVAGTLVFKQVWVERRSPGERWVYAALAVACWITMVIVSYKL